ncbi:hypothetical protein GCM10022232_55100 [Streptomyces plumbiresistens]|uniref:Transposase n=1 Tax=Streptomyces plumbiresistens TaxID=511811 RepID=A0ABP7S884_9ACTN
MEICIAVADWARGLTTWVLDVPGGGSTDATRRNRTKHARDTLYLVRSRSGPTDGSTG